MRKILLIGGAGYIGSVLTDHLLKAGHSVRCLDLFLYENQVCAAAFLNQPGYEFLFGDFSDPATVERALKGVSDVVILGGLVGDPITKKYPDLSERINSRGVLSLVDALRGRGLDRVVFISTCSNYGLIEGDKLADEETELKPLSLYAKAKVQIEETLLARRGKVDYCPTILRFATAFGLSPRTRFDLTINEFTRDMYLKRDLLVFDAQTWRPYCHVLDFAIAIEKTLNSPRSKVEFEVFNVGGEQNNFTKQMIVDEIKTFLPDAPVAYKEHGSDPRNYRVSFEKIRSALDFQPRYSVNHGIRTLLDALRQRVFSRVDQQKRFHINSEIDDHLQ